MLACWPFPFARPTTSGKRVAKRPLRTFFAACQLAVACIILKQPPFFCRRVTNHALSFRNRLQTSTRTPSVRRVALFFRSGILKPCALQHDAPAVVGHCAVFSVPFNRFRKTLFEQRPTKKLRFGSTIGSRRQQFLRPQRHVKLQFLNLKSWSCALFAAKSVFCKP